MQSESVHIAGGVLRRFADGRVLIEVEEGLAIGDMVRFISLLSGQPACPSEVVSRMESKDGQLIYLAKTGEKIILRPAHPLEPGDWIEKTHGPGCLRIEAIINPKDICFLNGVMEGYSDMAVLRTLDSSVGLVELRRGGTS